MEQCKAGFLVGAATAAHQVEGNNRYNDCWAMEQMKHTTYAEPSLDAVDHYHHFEEDIRLMKEAGLNAYRFSIEWARIEPEEGRFDAAETEHYRRVLQCCRENGIEPVVTLHHFSSPVWLIRRGGWESEDTPVYFARYCRYLMEQLGSLMTVVCTINEANMGIQIAAIAKRYRMQAEAAAKKAAEAAQKAAAESGTAGAEQKTGAAQNPAGDSSDGKVQLGMNLAKMMENRRAAAAENEQIFGTPSPQVFTSPRTPEGDRIIMKAHQAARAVIRELYPGIRVGLTLSLHDLQALEGGQEAADAEWENEFLHYLPYIQDDDFLGIQNYTRSQYGPGGLLPVPEGAETTQMQYEFYPEALGHVIRRVHESFHGALYVTENGIATADDERRIAFIRRALAGVQECIADGIPVNGYFYWSLLDNFEWQKGFSMTFGLIAVDRTTQTRMPKKSLAYLGSFCA